VHVVAARVEPAAETPAGSLERPAELEDRCDGWPESWGPVATAASSWRASARSSARCGSVVHRRRAPGRALPGLIRHAKLLGAMVPGRPPTQSSWTRCRPSSPTNQEL
jgi:hypothetical protein